MEQPTTNPTSFLSSAGNRIMLILMLISLTVGITFAYLYKTNQNALIDQKSVAQTLAHQNEQLAKEIEEREKINEIDKKTITDLEKALGDKNTQFTEVEKTIDDKVNTVMKKYSALPKTDSNKTAMEREISAERVKGAWLLYCKQNPTHERCK